MGSSHHGARPSATLLERMYRARDEDLAAMRKRGESLLTPNITLGKQDDFPEGRYGPDDEGSLALAVGHDVSNQRVVVDFGTHVTWLAIEPAQARHLAQMLIVHADACGSGKLEAAIRETLAT